MMRLQTPDSPGGFLRLVRAYLERDEAAAGLILGLALRLVEDPLAFGSQPYFAAVMGEEGPVLAALMTPPHNLILYAGRECPDEALELVARDLAGRGWPVPGIRGTPLLTQAFAAHWSRLTGAAGRTVRCQRLYRLDRVIHPRYSPGHLRPAEVADARLVLGWMRAFEQEALPGTPVASPEMAAGRIAEGNVFLWDDDGPVCMAMRTRPTAHGVSVSWVYTPPALRRRGYATSCVAALSQSLLDAGFAYCTLFADLENPTSNHIYQMIGYRPVCDLQEVQFEPGAG